MTRGSSQATQEPGFGVLDIEMLWRHFRREVTHCDLFLSIQAVIEASYAFFQRYNQRPEMVLSIIGALPS
jgi:hypothetical protein